MKHKRKWCTRPIYVMMAVALVLSLWVIALPTQAAEVGSSGLADYVLQKGGGGIAEWSTTQVNNGSYSVKLTLPEAFSGEDYALVKILSPRVWHIKFRFPFSEFSASYWFYVDSSTECSVKDTSYRKGVESLIGTPLPAYTGPYMIIELDTDGNHEYEPAHDRAIVQWEYAICPDDGFYVPDMWQEDIVSDTETFFCTKPFNIMEHLPLSHFKELYGEEEVVGVKICTGGQSWQSVVQGSAFCYVDSVTIHGVTYDLEFCQWLGDVNCDGRVNVLDMVLIGQRWGETGTPGWIREDINGDGCINILDMVLLSQRWTG